MPKSLEERFIDYWTLRARGMGATTRMLLDENPVFRGILIHALAGSDYRDALDVGTGAGLMAVELSRLGLRTVGIDSSQAMVDQAVGVAQEYGADVEYRVDNAQNPKIRKESFDVVVAKDCVWNLVNPRKSYANWADILRPGGRLVVIDNNFYLHYSNEDYRKRYDDMKDEPPHMTRWIREIVSRDVDPGICHELAKELPLTSVLRPGWDVSILMGLGFDNIRVQCLDHHHYYLTEGCVRKGIPMSFVVTASKPYADLDMSTAHMLRSDISIQKLRKNAEDFQECIGDVLKCLSNEGCRKILFALCSTDLNVADCARIVGCSHALASHDLRLLKDASLLGCRRSGKESIYYLKDRDMVCRLM